MTRCTFWRIVVVGYLLAFIFMAWVAWGAGSWPVPGPGRGTGTGGGASSVTDDFSSDTSANYSVVAGSGLAISGGYATMGADSYAYAAAVHNTALSSANHYIDGTVEIGASSTGSVNLIVRSNGTTGYMARIYYDGSQAQLESFDGGTSTYLGTFASSLSYTSGFHRFKLEASGTSFTLRHWNGSSWDQVGTSITDATYATGGKVGAWWRNNGAKVRFDTFTAGVL